MSDYKKAREEVAKLLGIELKELTYLLYKKKRIYTILLRFLKKMGTLE